MRSLEKKDIIRIVTKQHLITEFLKECDRNPEFVMVLERFIEDLPKLAMKLAEEAEKTIPDELNQKIDALMDAHRSKAAVSIKVTKVWTDPFGETMSSEAAEIMLKTFDKLSKSELEEACAEGIHDVIIKFTPIPENGRLIFSLNGKQVRFAGPPAIKVSREIAKNLTA